MYEQSGDAALAGGLMAALGVYWLIMMVFLVILIVAQWKIFTKAGKPGWASIVPIYNVIVLLEIVGRPIRWILLFLIPLVNVVVMLIVYNDLSKSFGKGIGFTIGLILLSPVFFLILGFGSDRYIGPGGAAMASAPPAYTPPASAPPAYTPPTPPAPPAPPTA